MRLLKTLLTIQLFYDTGKHTANDTVQKGVVPVPIPIP